MTWSEDLSTLVAFPTVSDRPCDPLAAWLANRCEDLGLRVETFPSPEAGKRNLVASVGPMGTDGLVLSGHMDVVPTEGQPWTSDPFTVTRRGDRLVGRGTADMKGFLAATLAALALLDRRAFRRELVLMWTYDEEVGCAGSAALARDWDRVARPLPTACLIGEPTDLTVARMHSGHVAVHIDVLGEAAHTSRPDLGVNAIEIASRVVEVVHRLSADLRARHDATLPMPHPWVPLVPTRIHGGTAINVVPDRCRIDLGYRPLPGMADDAVFLELQARLDRALGADRARVHAHLGAIVPSLLTPDGTALAALLAPHANPGPVGVPFATDAGNLARLGLAPLVFGPGSIDVAHKADEYVEIGAIERTIGVLEQVIAARCLTAQAEITRLGRHTRRD